MNRASTSEMMRNNRGFTLIEIIIAIFILTVALMGVISVTIMIINGNDFSRRITTATTLAKDKIEEIKEQSYAAAASGTDYLNIDSSTGSSGAYFTRIWTVTNNSPATNMKAVAVQVTWTWKGLTRSVTLNTIIGQ